MLLRTLSSDNLFFNRKIDPSSSWAPHRIFNVGNSNTINLMDFINILENELGINAIKEFTSMQDGDVVTTFVIRKDDITENFVVRDKFNFKKIYK